MTRARNGLLTLGLAGCLALIGPSAAPANTVTIGSPLTAALPPSPFNLQVTAVNTALPEPGALVAAPANGTIVSWKVIGASGGPLKLRVVHPVAGGLFTGAGKASSGPITGTGVLTFSANLPIKQGDLIGVDPTNNSDTVGAADGLAGSFGLLFFPPLADGAPGVAPVLSAPGEIGLNAQVLLNCVVPKLKGKKVGAAKRALTAAGCDPPRVKRKKGQHGKFVGKQNPKPGAEIPSDRAVVLKLRPKKPERV
jgi:hypothetical protein